MVPIGEFSAPLFPAYPKGVSSASSREGSTPGGSLTSLVFCWVCVCMCVLGGGGCLCFKVFNYKRSFTKASFAAQGVTSPF